MGSYFTERERKFLKKIAAMSVDHRYQVSLEALPIPSGMVSKLKKNEVRDLKTLSAYRSGDKMVLPFLEGNMQDIAIELLQLIGLWEYPAPRMDLPVQLHLDFKPKPGVQWQENSRERETLEAVNKTLKALTALIDEVLS